jgi:hypothetical protein
LPCLLLLDCFSINLSVSVDRKYSLNLACLCPSRWMKILLLVHSNIIF